MKRVIWLLAVLLLLTAYGGGSTPTTDTANPATDAPVGTMPGTEAPADEGTKDVLQADEWCTVEGQWKLTVHSAKAVKEHNEFADQKPAQVVIIQYSYENIGHKGDGSDLFFSPSTVVDGQKKWLRCIPSAQPSIRSRFRSEHPWIMRKTLGVWTTKATKFGYPLKCTTTAK